MSDAIQSLVLNSFKHTHAAASDVFREIVWSTCQRLAPLLEHHDQTIRRYAIDLLDALIQSAIRHEKDSSVRASLPEMRNTLLYLSQKPGPIRPSPN